MRSVLQLHVTTAALADRSSRPKHSACASPPSPACGRTRATLAPLAVGPGFLGSNGRRP
jgi:hypothetical protein